MHHILVAEIASVSTAEDLIKHLNKVEEEEPARIEPDHQLSQEPLHFLQPIGERTVHLVIYRQGEYQREDVLQRSQVGSRDLLVRHLRALFFHSIEGSSRYVGK